MSEPKEAVNLLSLGHFCARTANKKGSGDKTASPRNFSREILERRISRGGISRTRKFGNFFFGFERIGDEKRGRVSNNLEEEWPIHVFRVIFNRKIS